MNYLDWLSLKSVPGVGNISFKRLLKRFSTPENVFKAQVSELCSVPGISHNTAHAIKSKKIPRDLARDMEAALASGCRMIVFTDTDYPALLREIPDPPPFVFVLGQIPDLPAVAIVGSRNASSYGLQNARRLSSDLTRAGALVISGLARGIDTAAHEGALDAGGFTVAILGHGLSRIYPQENVSLARRILKKGALISEFPYFAAPEARHFPMRNRIISGMTLGTLVVEAAPRSGSLITARLALEQNREVFAVPGSIRSFKSSGTHSLLKQGAKLVETVEDILEELPVSRYDEKPSNEEKKSTDECMDDMIKKFNLDFNEASVLKVLDSYPVHIDDILCDVAMEPGLLSGILLKLELLGLVCQSPGKLFSVNEDVL